MRAGVESLGGQPHRPRPRAGVEPRPRAGVEPRPRAGTEANPYLPMQARVESITMENEAKDLKTFRLRFREAADASSFTYRSGQFAMLSVKGAGECPIGIASSPLDEGYLEFTVKRYPDGLVSASLHNLEEGAVVGVRGPYGNSFPLEEMTGKNVLIIGGGFAFTTLRSAIRTVIHETNRRKFRDITVIYGARSPGELLYKEELSQWEGRPDMKVVLTVDKAESGWKGREGFVPAIAKETAVTTGNDAVIVCGPPVMLKFTIPVLLEAGFAPEVIYTSLERRMSCGLGKCGKCSISHKYVCKDGPIFSVKEIGTFLEAVF
jgi:sulfhydrogenase subunit gamma (sulfur reductase)